MSIGLYFHKIMDESFEKKLSLFEDNKKQHARTTPLRIIENDPKIPQITPSTRRFLKLKSLIYLLKEDHHKIFNRFIFKRPLYYGWNFLKSIVKKNSYQRNEDAFFYGIQNLEEWNALLKDPNSLLVIGFSYCHKPLECPSGRFNSNCQNDPKHPVCGQCLIHKYKTLAETPSTLVFVIPTIHYIGEKILKVTKNYPDRNVIFLITACQMTLQMFGDWGNMAQIKGIGIRLGGRICNTMKAFELSERGIKPGLTTLSTQADKLFIDSLKLWASQKRSL